MEAENILERLGLGSKEAAVYRAGLELGPASVQALSIKSKIKRTTVYEVVRALKEQELFTETVKKNKRLFVAAHPNQLKVLMNDRQQLLERNFKELTDITNTASGKPHVQYYDSLEGIQKMYEDALTGLSSDTIGISGSDAAERLNAEWLERYIKRRKKKGVAAKTILTESTSAQEWMQHDAKDNRETKLLGKEKKLPVNIEVVGEQVLISSLDGEVLGLSIESPRVAESVRSMLTFMWDSLD